MVNRFVSNADGLMGSDGVLSLSVVVVGVAVTVSSRRLVNAEELTRGIFFCRFLLIMQRASSAVGVDVAGVASAVAGRLRLVRSRLSAFVSLLCSVWRLR